MSCRPAPQQLAGRRTISRLLRATPTHCTFHCSPRSTRAVFLDVCARASEASAPATTSAPAVARSVNIDDDDTITEFMLSVRRCRSVKDLKKLVDGKGFNSQAGSLELNHVLRKFRELETRSDVPWGKKGSFSEFGRFLTYETKQCMWSMLPRTIANCVHYLQALGILDKLTLVKVSTAVSKRVAQDPKAFNITEIAQICGGCSRLRFDNTKLNKALATNILALSDSELNPRAVLNVVYSMNKIGLSDPEVCKFLLAHLTKNVGMLEVYDLPRVALPADRLKSSCPTESSNLLQALQYAVCRQKPNSITAMNAARLLRDLANSGALEQEAAHTLIAIVQREKSFGKSLNSVLQQAEPALTKLGYQVKLESAFSDLASKEASKASSTPAVAA